VTVPWDAGRMIYVRSKPRQAGAVEGGQGRSAGPAAEDVLASAVWRLEP
jgi:hypothetical protein